MDTRHPSLGLGSSRVLLTGATGFLGQAVLERLLSDHPSVRVLCLVRRRGDLSGTDRLLRLAHRPVFRRWREEVGTQAVVEALLSRCEVLEGSVGDLDRHADRLTGLDAVLHSASAVSFESPVDLAFSTNVEGAAALCSSLLAVDSSAHLIHVSTAYVSGERRGSVPEGPLEHQVLWRAEAEAAASERRLAEDASRRPELLRSLRSRALRREGATGPQATARATESLRDARVTERLVQVGRARARSLGWADAYAHTKALAERVVEEGWAGSGRRLTVLRPSIIESALRHPHPGWIDGYKTADPLIIAFGRGQLPQFPGLPDSVLDVVPVDFVVNAIIAAAASPPPAGAARHLHVTTGAANPLHLHRLHAELHRWFSDHPLPPADASAVAVPPTWRFPGGKRLARSTARAEHAMAAAAWLLERAPGTGVSASALAAVRRRRAGLELLSAYNDVYAPYVQTEAVFADDAAVALQDAHGLRPGDARGFRAADVDWHEYLQGVHLPAITSATRAGERRAQQPRPTPAPAVLQTPSVAVVDLGALVPWRAVLVAQVALVLAALPAERRTPALVRWCVELAAGAGRGPVDHVRAIARILEDVPAERLAEVASRSSSGSALLRRAAPSVVEALAHHREAGHRTVLVTAALDVLVLPFAPMFDEVVATSLHVRPGGLLTGYLEAAPVAGEALAARLVRDDPARSAVGGTGVGAPSTYAYGSSALDIAWLSVVGQPVVVGPDQSLRDTAERRRWPVLDRRSSAAAWAVLGSQGPTTGSTSNASGDVIDLRASRVPVRLPHQVVRSGSVRAGDQVSEPPRA